MTASFATSRPRRPIMIAVAAGALLADMATKIVGVALLEHSSVGPGWARLLVVRNSGFAFGIGARWSDGAVLAVTVIVVAAVVAAVWRGALMGPVPAGLILGGALANVLDRAVDGSVVDLIDIGRWPTFNLADTFIVAGLALIMVRGGSSAGNPSAIHDESG